MPTTMRQIGEAVLAVSPLLALLAAEAQAAKIPRIRGGTGLRARQPERRHPRRPHVATFEVLSVRYGGLLLAPVSPFLCPLAMLTLRPWGLFGSKEELERV